MEADYYFRRHPKPTKKNIKKLLEEERKAIDQQKRKFQNLVAVDIQMSHEIVTVSQQSHNTWHDLQDINQGRLETARLRALKTQISQLLESCIQNGTITNLRALANLNDPELETFLRELDRQREGFRNDDIRNFPFYKYEAQQDGEIDESCSICHQNFVQGVECVKLECNHFYHRACILTWFKVKKQCPLCKRVIKTPNPSANNDQNQRPNAPLI